MAQQDRKTGDDHTGRGLPRAQPAHVRGLGLVLILSLGLNLLLIGVLGGAWLRDWQRAGPQAAQAVGQPDRKIITLGLRPYWRAMSPADRAALASAVRAQRKQLRAGLSGPRILMRDFVRAIRADPLDKALLESVFARQSALVAARVEAGQKALAARIEAMTPAARKAFARRLIEARKTPRRARQGRPPSGE